jgi:predicted nucleic acid-binding protein
VGLILSQVPSGERIFIDANIFLYSVFGHAVYGKSCNDFLRRAENDEIMLTAADAAHLAAMESFGIASMASNDWDFQRVPWLKLWRPENMNR